MINYALDTPSTSSMIHAASLTLSGQQFSDFNFTPTANFTPGNYPLMNADAISGSLDKRHRHNQWLECNAHRLQ